MHRARDVDAFDSQKILEQVPGALRRRVEVMMREAVQRLKEGHAAIELAAAFQNARDLRRASEGIAHMFQNGDGEHRVERIAFKG